MGLCFSGLSNITILNATFYAAADMALTRTIRSIRTLVYTSASIHFLTFIHSCAQGDIAWGGYSEAVRCHERFVIPIPDGLPLEQAAPMLCAGLTVYSPLVRNGAGYVA